jgi:hypothetical protein
MSTPVPHFFNILVAPTETLSKLRERTFFLFPFLVVLGSQALVIVFYYQVVDFDWLMEYMLAALPEDMSPQARESVLENNRRMSPTLMAGIGTVSSAIMFSIIWTINAGYLTLASSLRGDNIKIQAMVRAGMLGSGAGDPGGHRVLHHDSRQQRRPIGAGQAQSLYAE